MSRRAPFAARSVDHRRRAQEAGHVLGISRRCHLIRERDGSAAGLRFARQELRRLADRGSGRSRRDKVANLVAWETGHDGDIDGPCSSWSGFASEPRRSSVAITKRR